MRDRGNLGGVGVFLAPFGDGKWPCTWMIYGLYMDDLWYLYGLYMVCVWFMSGLYMVYIWLMYGCIYGLYMYDP